MPAILARIRGGRERGLVARTWLTDSPSVATRRGPRHYPAERVQSPPDSSKDDSPSLCHFYAPRLQYIRPHCLPFTRSKISRPNRKRDPSICHDLFHDSWNIDPISTKEFISFREMIINDRRKKRREKKNKWKIFNESRIGKYICSSEVFTQWIKISYYRNARVYTHTHINVYTYIYIREVETTWCIYSEMIRI